MGEIKKKLNISKITVKNLFLIILVMAVMAVIGIIAKSIGGKVANINTAWIQSCSADVPAGCDGGTEGGGGSCSAGCDSEASF